MIQTSVSSQVVDQKRSYPTIEGLRPFDDFQMQLGSNINLDQSSLDLTVDMSLKEILEGDYLELIVPSELIIDNLSCVPMMCSFADGKIKVQ